MAFGFTRATTARAPAGRCRSSACRGLPAPRLISTRSRAPSRKTTSARGGIITMALSVARPALIRGAVLNDIGPGIEGKGLARIRGYIGKLPPPANEREAVEILKN